MLNLQKKKCNETVKFQAIHLNQYHLFETYGRIWKETINLPNLRA